MAELTATAAARPGTVFSRSRLLRNMWEHQDRKGSTWEALFVPEVSPPVGLFM